MISGNNQGALLNRLLRDYHKQFIENAKSSARDEQTDGARNPAASEKVRMTETKIYVGLNDAQTKEQRHETEKYMGVLKDVCRNYHVAFSVNIEDGGYYHDDGEYTEETSFVLVLINADQEVVKEIANDLCSFFRQESVLITEKQIEGYFICGKPLE